MTALWTVIYAVIPSAFANTPLDSSWTPLSYGQCTVPGNVEVVGSVSQGNTCNFNGAASYMPNLWTNKYLLAVSQDLYNGFHTQDDFQLDCNVQTQTENNTNDNCGMICGWCFLINGPLGSAIYIANEIADINAVGQNGAGINLHIDDDTIGKVRSGLSLGYDIDYKKVPCPGTEAGIYLYWHQWNHLQNFKNSVYFTPIRHRIGVKAMYLRHGIGATDRKWYRMPRTWTNQYKWESYSQYSAGCCPIWQPANGNIYGSASTFDIKIVSYLDEEVICYDLTIADNTEYETRQCLDNVGASVQFTDNGYTIPTTSCDGETLQPTNNPSYSPLKSPTEQPTFNPSVSPIQSPTNQPINSQTTDPIKSPTSNPIPEQTDNPSRSPADFPTFTQSITINPTNNPTYIPTSDPSQTPTYGPVTKCDEHCQEDSRKTVWVKVKFWFPQWIVYDFTNFKCWIYKILVTWFDNFEFIAYFEACDIEIIVIGGHANTDSNVCIRKPCISNHNNQRRILLQDDIDDGNVTLEIISSDKNTMNAINELSLHSMSNQFYWELHHNFAIDMKVNIEVINEEKNDKNNVNILDIKSYTIVELVIGGVVLFVVVVFIVLLVIVCCKRCKQRNAYRTRDIATTEMIVPKRASLRTGQNHIITTDDDEYDNDAAFNTDLYPTSYRDSVYT